MKSFLLIICVLLFSITNVEASTAYNPNRPSWKEFCPYGLDNAQKDKKFHLWATESRYKADNQNYWVERRADFEQDLQFCDSVQSDKQDSCYDRLRERQLQINASYVSPWEKAEIRAQNMQQMSQVYTINNYADALRNQRVNVFHSGTVNHNVNGTFYHY